MSAAEWSEYSGPASAFQRLDHRLESATELQRRLEDMTAARDNLFPMLVAAEKRNATYAHELQLLTQALERAELERDCEELRADRAEARLQELEDK